MKALLIAILWAATVALAWFFGTNHATDNKGHTPRERNVRVDPPVQPPDRAQPVGHAAETTDDPAPAANAKPKPAPQPANKTPQEPYTTEGVDSLEELSRRLMKFADQKLKEGPAGHKELFREIDRLMQDRELRKLARREEDFAPFAYPWIKFAVDRDRKLIAMMETLYKTAADEPQWFAELDDDSFEMFTEGLAFLVPSAAPDRMETLRGHAERFLKHPVESLPKALQRNRRDIERNLEWWAPAVDPEEARAALMAGTLDTATALRYLDRLDREALRGLPVTRYLRDGLTKGSSQAMRLLRKAELSAADVADLDTAFLEGVRNGRMNAWHFANFAQGTGRKEWADLEPLMENLLRIEGKADEIAMSLNWLRPRPPRDFVVRLLSAHTLQETTRARLKQTFKIE